MLNQFQTDDASEQTSIRPEIVEVETAAVEAIKEAKETQTSQSVHQLLTKVRRQAKREKIVFWILLIFFQFFFFPQFVFSGRFPIWHRGHVDAVAAAMLFLPMFGIALMVLRLKLTKRRWNAEELKRVGGLQAIGTLIDLLATPRLLQQSKSVSAALTELLPQMKANDANLLNSAQRETLNMLLQGYINVGLKPDELLKLRLAILKAFEHVGDASSIPAVLSLTIGKERTENQKTLKAAALECLPLLRTKSGAVDATNMLLRASSLEDTAHETLLRASKPAPDANPKEMLRASDAITPRLPG